MIASALHGRILGFADLSANDPAKIRAFYAGLVGWESERSVEGTVTGSYMTLASTGEPAAAIAAHTGDSPGSG